MMIARRFGASANPRSGHANNVAPVQAFQIASVKTSCGVTHPSIVVRAHSSLKTSTSQAVTRIVHPEGTPYRMDDLRSPYVQSITRDHLKEADRLARQ
jgi:hypothetical protein